LDSQFQLHFHYFYARTLFISVPFQDSIPSFQNLIIMALEKKLIDLANLCIRTIQFLGYFPVGIEKSCTKMGEKTKSLNFKFSSAIVLYTTLLLASSAGWEIVYLFNLRSFLRYIKLFGPTERYAHHSYVLVISTLGLFFRISGFWDMKRTLSFWKQNCYTLEKVQVLLGYQIEDNFIEQPEFQSIKGKLRWSILFNLLTITLHVFLVYGKRIYFSFTDETKGWTEDVTFNMGSGFWTLLCLFHVLYSMWLCYFIHIYTAAFSCLSRKIQSLRDNHTNFPGIIYVSEIIGVHQEQQPTFLRSRIGPSKTQQFNEKTAALTAATMLETQLNRYMEAFRALEHQVLSFISFFGGKLILEMTLCITNLVVNSFFITIWLGRANILQVAQLVVPIMVFLYQLYNFGTVAGRMSIAAGSVANAILESVPFGILGPETMLRVNSY